MLSWAAFVMAGFTAPMDLGTDPRSLLLLLPLLAAITIVYKATKLPVVSPGNFLKESVILFCSIVVFMVVSAAVLLAAARLIIG